MNLCEFLHVLKGVIDQLIHGYTALIHGHTVLGYISSVGVGHCNLLKFT